MQQFGLGVTGHYLTAQTDDDHRKDHPIRHKNKTK